MFTWTIHSVVTRRFWFGMACWGCECAMSVWLDTNGMVDHVVHILPLILTESLYVLCRRPSRSGNRYVREQWIMLGVWADLCEFGG